MSRLLDVDPLNCCSRVPVLSYSPAHTVFTFSNSPRFTPAHTVCKAFTLSPLRPTKLSKLLMLEFQKGTIYLV